MDISGSSGVRSAKPWAIALISGLALLFQVSQLGGLAQTSTTNEATLKAEAEENSVKTLLRCGISKHRSGDNVQAEEYFKEALSIDHENADALFNLGVIAEQKGDLESALRNYQAALKSDPTDHLLVVWWDYAGAADSNTGALGHHYNNAHNIISNGRTPETS